MYGRCVLNPKHYELYVVLVLIIFKIITGLESLYFFLSPFEPISVFNETTDRIGQGWRRDLEIINDQSCLLSRWSVLSGLFLLVLVLLIQYDSIIILGKLAMVG